MSDWRCGAAKEDDAAVVENACVEGIDARDGSEIGLASIPLMKTIRRLSRAQSFKNSIMIRCSSLYLVLPSAIHSTVWLSRKSRKYNE